jgi:hypothetical protein
MSLSESQYYEAKVFLKALADAHTTLEYKIYDILEIFLDNKPNCKNLSIINPV